MPSINGLNITRLHGRSTFSYIIYLVHVAPRSKHGIHTVLPLRVCVQTYPPHYHQQKRSSVDLRPQNVQVLVLNVPQPCSQVSGHQSH